MMMSIRTLSDRPVCRVRRASDCRLRHTRSSPPRRFPTRRPASATTSKPSLGWWNPSPEFEIASESLGMLGIENQRRHRSRHRAEAASASCASCCGPRRKHKFRINYLPMSYSAQSRRCIATSSSTASGTTSTCRSRPTCRGRRGISGYEYDFLYRDRWFVGIRAAGQSHRHPGEPAGRAIGSEFARAQAPIPTIGGIGRVYVAPNISITGELVVLQDSASIDDRYQAHYFDFDLYGTVNFNDYVGAQLGYRSLDLGYIFEDDHGDFKAKGIYFGGVVRY